MHIMAAAAALFMSLAAAAQSAEGGLNDGIFRQVLFKVDAADTSRRVSCYRIPALTTAPDGSIIADAILAFGICQCNILSKMFYQSEFT